MEGYDIDGVVRSRQNRDCVRTEWRLSVEFAGGKDSSSVSVS